jgi:hypothetical protein
MGRPLEDSRRVNYVIRRALTLAEVGLLSTHLQEDRRVTDSVTIFAFWWFDAIALGVTPGQSHQKSAWKSRFLARRRSAERSAERGLQRKPLILMRLPWG